LERGVKYFFVGGHSRVVELKPMVVVVALVGAVWAQACGGIVEIDASAGAGGRASVGVAMQSGGRAAVPVSTSTGGRSAAGGFVSVGSSEPGVSGVAAKGAELYDSSRVACSSCHAQNAAGLYGPNITSSKTAGIGAWTYPEFLNAVRRGKDRDGSDLCVSMSRFPSSVLSDQEVEDLYAFLKSKPAVDLVNKGVFCPD
jgi:cytochrome c553